MDAAIMSHTTQDRKVHDEPFTAVLARVYEWAAHEGQERLCALAEEAFDLESSTPPPLTEGTKSFLRRARSRYADVAAWFALYGRGPLAGATSARCRACMPPMGTPAALALDATPLHPAPTGLTCDRCGARSRRAV